MMKLNHFCTIIRILYFIQIQLWRYKFDAKKILAFLSNILRIIIIWIIWWKIRFQRNNQSGIQMQSSLCFHANQNGFICLLNLIFLNIILFRNPKAKKNAFQKWWKAWRTSFHYIYGVNICDIWLLERSMHEWLRSNIWNFLLIISIYDYFFQSIMIIEAKLGTQINYRIRDIYFF